MSVVSVLYGPFRFMNKHGQTSSAVPPDGVGQAWMFVFADVFFEVVGGIKARSAYIISDVWFSCSFLCFPG